MSSELVQSLADEAVVSLSPEEAKKVAARIDRVLFDATLSAGDRGTLLTARAIAGQHFEPVAEARVRLLEAIPLLEEAEEFERHVGALAAAASVSFMLGHLRECMELAVRALMLSATNPDAVPMNVPANLGVLFNEFSAFDLSFELSGAAFDEFDGETSDGPALICAFNLARTVLEAAWHEDDIDTTEFRRRLDIARDTGERILAGGLPEGEASEESERTRVLIGRVLMSEAALVVGDVDEAERHIGHALAVPEGSQLLLEGYAHLVAGMVARRGGRLDEALAFFDAAEPSLEHEVHRIDRLRAERSATFAELGDFESAYIDAAARADIAMSHNVRYMGAVIEQIRARAEAENSRRSLVEVTDALTERTRRDSLTGVSARGWFDSCLEHRATEQEQLAIILLDLDNFKAVNDTFSHLVGDAVLRRLGALLMTTCDELDVVARYGGEEFIVLPVEGDLISAHELAERIRKAVEAEPWWVIHEDLVVTTSIGVTAGPATSAPDILRAADSALYASKDAGRNCVIAQRLGQQLSLVTSAGSDDARVEVSDGDAEFSKAS